MPYASYKSFNWSENVGLKNFRFTDARQQSLRKAQIASALRRKGQSASRSLTKIRAKQAQREAAKGVLEAMKDWSLEGLGFGDLSADERAFMVEYKDITGNAPPIFENPYVLERMGKMVDKAFTAASVYVGGGLAVQGIKAGIKGTQLASSQLVRATTKAQVKKAIMSKARQLAQKQGIKGRAKSVAGGTAKAALKGVEVEYKASVIGELTGMMKKGFKEL
jgi:hypothetical protein